MLEPKVLICDEISSGLDPLNEYEIITLINKMNISTIYITHSIFLIKNIFSKIYYLNNKKIKEFSSFNELIEKENDEYILSLKGM